MFQKTKICMECGKKYEYLDLGIIVKEPPIDINAYVWLCDECRKEKLKKIKNIIKGKR